MKLPALCRFLPLVALALSLTGCGTPDVMPSGLAAVVPATRGTPPNKAVELTIYRPRKIMGFGLHPTMRMNGKDLVTVPNKRVFRTRLAPGRYVFDVDGHKSGAELDAKAGEKYYFLVTIEPGVFAGNGALTLVAPQQGEYEAKELEPVDKDNIDALEFR